MCRVFNVNANCIPERHYMVDISSRLAEIKKMVDNGNYFTINRARQYGKTTTLKALSKVLEKEYSVAAIDFQMVSASKFKSENTFSITFAKMFIQAMQYGCRESEPENRGLRPSGLLFLPVYMI